MDRAISPLELLGAPIAVRVLIRIDDPRGGRAGREHAVEKIGPEAVIAFRSVFFAFAGTRNRVTERHEDRDVRVVPGDFPHPFAASLANLGSVLGERLFGVVLLLAIVEQGALVTARCRT